MLKRLDGIGTCLTMWILRVKSSNEDSLGGSLCPGFGIWSVYPKKELKEPRDLVYPEEELKEPRDLIGLPWRGVKRIKNKGLSSLTTSECEGGGNSDHDVCLFVWTKVSSNSDHDVCLCGPWLWQQFYVHEIVLSRGWRMEVLFFNVEDDLDTRYRFLVCDLVWTWI